jgi:hypothetical protein
VGESEISGQQKNADLNAVCRPILSTTQEAPSEFSSPKSIAPRQPIQADGSRFTTMCVEWNIETSARCWLSFGPRELSRAVNARLQTPKGGAECLNRARSDVCVGRPAMGVTTAIGEDDLEVENWPELWVPTFAFPPEPRQYCASRVQETGRSKSGLMRVVVCG